MSLGRHRRKVVEESSVGANERNGQTEGTVFESLSLFEPDRRFEFACFGHQIDPAARFAHIARDIGTRRLARAEAHRLRFMRRDEPEIAHLPHRPSRKADAILAVVFGPEATRITVVGPGRRAEKRHLERGVAARFGSHRLVGVPVDHDVLPIPREEHRLAFSEGAQLGEQIRAGKSPLPRWLRGQARSDRDLQGGLGRVEPSRKLHPRNLELFRDFREAVRITILRQLVADVERGQREEVAEAVLVFDPGESPHRAPSLCADRGTIGFNHRTT